MKDGITEIKREKESRQEVLHLLVFYPNEQVHYSNGPRLSEQPGASSIFNVGMRVQACRPSPAALPGTLAGGWITRGEARTPTEPIWEC